MWKPLAFGQGLFIKITQKIPLIVIHVRDLKTCATGNNPSRILLEDPCFK